MIITVCTFSDTDTCAPAAAHLSADLVGHGAVLRTELALCFRHLNSWLDRADEGHMPEPRSLAFVDPCSAEWWAWWSVDPANGEEPLRQVSGRVNFEHAYWEA